MINNCEHETEYIITKDGHGERCVKCGWFAWFEVEGFEFNPEKIEPRKDGD